MENYKIVKKLGDGTYGCVFRATNVNTGQIVAIKKFKKKYTSWEECIQLREIKALQKLKHPNIIKLIEVFKEKDELNLVFEFLDRDIYQQYLEPKKLIPDPQIRHIMRQVVEGLAYMHRVGYFHRDLKPENLLIHGETVKICDFGLAREIRSRPPYTDYVATRWYRAPEILLKSTNYNSPVDIFALGCIMAELYTNNPLFNGSSELDQLFKICQVLGTPTSRDVLLIQYKWPDCQKLANAAGISFPSCQGMPLERVISCPSDALDLIRDMLKYDPLKRPTAKQILEYPYFQGMSIHFEEPKITHHFEERKPLELPKIEKKVKQLESSNAFFDQILEQKLAEYDQKPPEPKHYNEPPKYEPKQYAPLYDNKPPLDRKIEKPPLYFNQKQATPQEEIKLESRNKNNGGNPFKLLKYNDPIANGQPSSHSYDPLARQPNKVNNQLYNFELQLPSVGVGAYKPKIESMPTRGKQYNNVANFQQHYPRSLPSYNVGKQIVGGNSRIDEFGFSKKYY